MSMWSPSWRPCGSWPSLSASPSTALPATEVPVVATICLVSSVPGGMVLTVKYRATWLASAQGT